MGEAKRWWSYTIISLAKYRNLVYIIGKFVKIGRITGRKGSIWL